MATSVVASTCRECYLGCGSLIHLQGGKVTKIAGNSKNPHSHGAFCTKGINAPIASLEHQDRVLYPLQRVGSRGDGNYERVTWDKAFAGITKGLSQVISGYGARAVAGAVSGQFYDRGVAMALLLRSLGSPNYMINQDICHAGRSTAALLTGVPMLPGIELKKARCILVVGKSPSDSNIIEWMNIKAAQREGATLIVIDPRRTQPARAADIWLAPRPGTDAALALSLIHILFEENLLDEDFVAQWCTGVDDLRVRASQYPPARASQITGIDPEMILETARLLGGAKPFSMLLGHGIDAQQNGVYTAMAFSALLALTGSIDREGTNQLPKGYDGFREYGSFIKDPAHRMSEANENEIIGGEDYPFWSSAHSVYQACHNPSVIEAILTGQPYPVRAMYASGVNIVCTYPDMPRTIEAIKSLDLFVVATDHMTPTAHYADFVLPKTTLLEENAVFIEDNCLSVIQRVVIPRGEVKTDFDIAIGLRDEFRKAGLLAFEVLPWNSHEEFIDAQMQGTGMTFADVCASGFHEFPFEYESYKKNGFKTPSGKVELSSIQLESAGYERTPDYRPPVYAKADKEFGLTLLTGIRTMALHHSRFRNHDWARKVHNFPDIRIHPETAEQFSIANDDWVWVEVAGRVGRVCLKARLTDEVPPDIVATGMGWWFPEQKRPDFGAMMFNVEAIIPYGPHWDPISGSAEARNCACRIYRVDDADVPNVPTYKAALTPSR